MTKPSIVDWHRLFGMIVERDFFDYAPLRTEREKDLSIKEQLIISSPTSHFVNP